MLVDSIYLEFIEALLLLHTVPSAPQNVTGELLNSITVRLHWDPPKSPNGVITGYQVIYSGYGTTVQVQQVRNNKHCLQDQYHSSAVVP